MFKASAKNPKATYKSLGDIYRRTLDELGRRDDMISRAVYESEVMRVAGGRSGRRITNELLGELLGKAKEADGERLMAIKAVIMSHLCENAAKGLAERISSDTGGQGLDDGFWFLAALGLLEEGRWREAEEIISRCRGPEARGMIWRALARRHAGRGDKEQTKRAVDGAAGEVRAQSDPQTTALGLCRLARRCAHLGIRDKGLALMGDVEGISVDGWSTDQITALLVSRARSMRALGKHGDALRLAEEALRHIEDSTVEVELEGSRTQEARGSGDRERDLVRLGAVFVQLGCDQRSQRCLELIGLGRWRQRFHKSCARACIRVGRLEKAAEFIEMISSPTVRMGLRLEMVRFYRRHGTSGEAKRILADVRMESARLQRAGRQELACEIAREGLRLEGGKEGLGEAGLAANGIREPLSRLRFIRSLKKEIKWAGGKKVKNQEQKLL